MTPRVYGRFIATVLACFYFIIGTSQIPGVLPTLLGCFGLCALVVLVTRRADMGWVSERIIPPGDRYLSVAMLLGVAVLVLNYLSQPILTVALAALLSLVMYRLTRWEWKRHPEVGGAAA